MTDTIEKPSHSSQSLTPVWLIATTFEPRGSSQYTLRLARGLPRYGFHATVFCESARQMPARYRRDLCVREIPCLRYWLPRIWSIRKLYKEFAAAPPELIHGQRRSLDVATLDFAAGLKRPYLLTIHDLLPANERIRILQNYFRGIVAVSPSVQRDLVQLTGLPAHWVRMIPNGVEIPSQVRVPSSTPGRIPVVAAACALEPVKGLTYFLLAAELILSSGYDVEFLIAGAGPDEEVLRRAAKHLDIANRVTFVTHLLEYREILEYVDVFVVSSLEQGLGTVMLEAMALGKPIVATQVGGMADFLQDGKHALLVPRANHVILAEKIKHVLDNPERARHLAATGQMFVFEQFGVERMVRATANLYREVLGLGPMPTDPEATDSLPLPEDAPLSANSSTNTASPTAAIPPTLLPRSGTTDVTG